jgi:hypothetical protein
MGALPPAFSLLEGYNVPVSFNRRAGRRFLKPCRKDWIKIYQETNNLGILLALSWEAIRMGRKKAQTPETALAINRRLRRLKP